MVPHIVKRALATKRFGGKRHRMSDFRFRGLNGLDPSGKCGGVLRRLHCLCLELDGACECQCRVPTFWIIEPVDVFGYGGFSVAS